MLVELRVRQLGVIEDLTLSFGAGMTALSGETGAGKTLVVEALQLVLGQRADPGLVRAGESEAVVEARFFDDDGEETVVMRTVPVAGRSRCWINGRMAPLGALAELSGDLADIHGQGEHQALLHTAGQRRALDEFGGIDPGPVDALRHRIAAVGLALTELGGDEHARARDADVLAHQTREIELAGLDDVGEDEQLLAEEERLGDLAAHREHAGAALRALDSDGTGTGALDLLGSAASALDGRAPLAELDRRIRSAQAELSDVATDLRVVVETWDDDPQRLESVQARRRQLSDLYRKYGGDRAEVLRFADDARERLERLTRAEQDAAALEADRRTLLAELGEAERALLDARLEAAPRLSAAIRARLGDLAMAGSSFQVEVEASGAGEAVTFLLGANAGESVRPLAKAASGGELARTMLALRLVAPGGPSTMVFDEVDAGVGGTAALALAEALREVGGHRQVLVVTHLAQVAAFADHQVSVRKIEASGRVSTRADAVSGPDRVVEVSRMLSGHPDSKRAQAHAEELLALGEREGAAVSRK
jgi:DNA repair protein RecN (Recombination protein N)